MTSYFLVLSHLDFLDNFVYYYSVSGPPTALHPDLFFFFPFYALLPQLRERHPYRPPLCVCLAGYLDLGYVGRVVAAPWTDHAAVELRIGASTRPTASWRFNDAMLRSPSFCSQIRIAWLHWATDPEGRPLAQCWAPSRPRLGA